MGPAQVTAAQPDMATADIVSMYASLMTFAIQVHKEQLTFVDDVLAGCAAIIAGRGRVAETKVRELMH